MSSAAIARRARGHARALGFEMASDEAAGRVLSLLAAATPPAGRILELGTGTGVGTAGLLAGLGSRSDVEVVSIEQDERVAAAAADNDWPDHLTLLVDDMLPQDWWTGEVRDKQEQVRRTLTGEDRLVAVEVPWETGLLLAVRRHDV